MKKLFLMVAALFGAVSFSACSDDDQDLGSSVIGTWEYTHFTAYDHGVLLEDEDIPKDDEPMHYLTFNENGTWTEEYPNSGHTSKGTYSIDGNELTKIYHDAKDYGYTEHSFLEMPNSTTLTVIDIDQEDGYDGREVRIYKRV